jgi:hypothetical protein
LNIRFYFCTIYEMWKQFSFLLKQNVTIDSCLLMSDSGFLQQVSVNVFEMTWSRTSVYILQKHLSRLIWNQDFCGISLKWIIFYVYCRLKLLSGNLYAFITSNQEQKRKMKLQVPGRNWPCRDIKLHFSLLLLVRWTISMYNTRPQGRRNDVKARGADFRERVLLNWYILRDVCKTSGVELRLIMFSIYWMIGVQFRKIHMC